MKEKLKIDNCKVTFKNNTHMQLCFTISKVISLNKFNKYLYFLFFIHCVKTLWTSDMFNTYLQIFLIFKNVYANLNTAFCPEAVD